ncbi:MAG: UDP-N-acetylmuramate dehydrogenase [Actinomycetota bacterium]|nr:UDP-N-acetylmuramate dehydrogenase [Actinomycetota bacterium]
MTLTQDVDLALHTTLRVGGPADVLVTVDDEDALLHSVRTVVSHAVPMLVLGRGSNLLVGDAGWPGVVIRLGAGLRGISIEGTTVRCGGAEPMPSVAVRTAQAGLAGFAWGAAVPGSMGGGVRMNAGAHGADMSDALVSARVLDPAVGRIEEWGPERLALGYRHSALPEAAIVTSVTLALTTADPATVLAEIDAIRAWRREHQPLNRPSCGSVFTNPPGTSAGALIDRVGLKGTRVGGAEVSGTHANFIVTSPGACASDVEQLIALVARRVREETGIELSAEVVRPGPTPEGPRA